MREKEQALFFDRIKANIQVRNKGFLIGFVSHFAIREFSEISEQANRVGQLYQHYLEAQKKGKIAYMKELEEAMREYNRIEFMDRRLNIIKHILEKNDIEYDSEFWEMNTGPDDHMQFLRDAITKDLTKEEKKNRVIH